MTRSLDALELVRRSLIAPAELSVAFRSQRAPLHRVGITPASERALTHEMMLGSRIARTSVMGLWPGRTAAEEQDGEQDEEKDDRRRPLSESQAGLPVISVLLVDDDHDAIDVLAGMIEAAGYTVACASDGHEALELLHRVRPELIFLDLGMPIMDGAHFREEQRHHQDWISIPTIVMTGGNDEPQLDLAVEKTLRKPVRARELLSIVRRHCTAWAH